MHHDDGYDAAAVAAAPPLAIAASPAPEPEPEQEPKWTRRDDKFLDLLIFTRNAVSPTVASGVIGKTPAQMQQRCTFMFAEIRHVLKSPEVLTPPVWDDHMEIVAMAAAAEEEVVPEAAVPAAPPVAVRKDSAEGAVGAGRGKRYKKKAEKWTEYEHRLFLAGLPSYRGNWNAMSKEYLTSRTASQIASHYQKYRNREKQRKLASCKRTSIHDITEPAGIAAAIAVSGGEVAAWKGELPRSEASAPAGQENEPARKPIERGEDELGPVEEFPGEDDPGTLLT